MTKLDTQLNSCFLQSAAGFLYLLFKQHQQTLEQNPYLLEWAWILVDLLRHMLCLCCVDIFFSFFLCQKMATSGTSEVAQRIQQVSVGQDLLLQVLWEIFHCDSEIAASENLCKIMVTHFYYVLESLAEYCCWSDVLTSIDF